MVHVITLPETTRTPSGFTVERASAGLLSELLDEYSFQLKKRSPNVFDAMLPGLSKTEIEQRLGEIAINPPDEVYVWWQWKNGFRPMSGYGDKIGQMRLSSAVKHYRDWHLGTDVGDWNPDWIPVAGTFNDAVAVCCRSAENPPRVRAVSTFEIGTQDSEGIAHQVVSLCTPVTWRLIAIAKGWDEWEPITATWGWDDSRYPLEWKLTNLM